MKTAMYQSDYSDSRLKIIQTDDGDMVLKILGNGEFRIATDGGKLHGDDLVTVIDSLRTILNIFEKQNNNF